MEMARGVAMVEIPGRGTGYFLLERAKWRPARTEQRPATFYPKLILSSATLDRKSR